MVDALRRAEGLLDSGGSVVDIHPTPEPAHLEVTAESGFTRLADRLDDGSPTGPLRRHAAADAAIAACVSRGMFKCEASSEFTFHTYADSVDELLEYLAAKWKQLHFADADLSRAREHLAQGTASAVVVTERVTARRLASCKRRIS